MDLFQSKAEEGGINPVALIDHYVWIHYNQNKILRQVDFLEPLPAFQAIDLGALAAGALTAKTNITNFDMYADEFAQFRIWTLDNVQLILYLPAGVPAGQLKTFQVPLSKFNALRNPSLNLTEICVWEDNRPAVIAINGSGIALSAVRIMAMGHHYHTVPVSATDPVNAKIKAGIQPVTHVWCSRAVFAAGNRT